MELQLEAKRILQWKDLEQSNFNNENILVKLNETLYIVIYNKLINEVNVCSYENLNSVIFLNGKFNDQIQFFNDLNLEVIEK